MEPAKYDLIVIGSGPAGEKGAVRAASFGKKVALVEEAPSHGGAVANTGVPEKAMRETALYLSGFGQRDLHGLTLAYDGTLTIDRFMHRGRAVRRPRWPFGQWRAAPLRGMIGYRGKRVRFQFWLSARDSRRAWTPCWKWPRPSRPSRTRPRSTPRPSTSSCSVGHKGKTSRPLDAAARGGADRPRA